MSSLATRVKAARKQAFATSTEVDEGLLKMGAAIDRVLAERAAYLAAILWAIEQVEANENPPAKVLANIGRGLRRVRSGADL